MTMPNRSFFVALLLATFGACAQEPANLVNWRPGLVSAAQPTPEWLGKAKEMNYDVLVNLAPPQVHGSLPNEGGIVGAKGVYYVNIPVNFSKPTAEDFRFFTEVLKANTGRSVFVHCQVNMRGTVFTFLYRVIHEGADPREALAKMQGVWNPDGVWKKFIEDTLAAHGKKVEIL
jgi:protein tyrosine phosphatase (PTP) superfamily phosphohydrolase (DUF442 family)